MGSDPLVHLVTGDPALAVTVRRSARARRISLRVAATDGRVTLTLPVRAPLQQGLDFAHARAEWIRAARARLPDPTRAAVGTLLPLEGVLHQISAPIGRGAPRQDQGVLILPGDPAHVGVRAAAYLRHLARDRLVRACDRYAHALGRPYRAIALRDTRSRWGSCAADGTLRFNWRLAMAPADVLHYVAAHEVAHLEQMNHSPAFWAVVQRLMPEYEPRRAWLRSHGASLQRWDFSGT